MLCIVCVFPELFLLVRCLLRATMRIDVGVARGPQEGNTLGIPHCIVPTPTSPFCAC